MANYDWSHQTAWSQGADAVGSHDAGCFAAGTWHLQGPTNSVAPVISGSTSVGSTLTSTTGTWSGNGTITYSYQWQRDGGTKIPGATASTYVITQQDEALPLVCIVTATDSISSSTRMSNAITAGSS